MKKLYLLACSVLWLSGETVFSQESIVPENCEYWLDMQFDRRVSVPITEEWNTELDVSTLSPGIHNIGLRISDNKGRWSVPFVKFFLRTSTAESSGNPTYCTYWIDTDFSKAKTVPFDNGNISLDLELNALSKGIHTFSYQASDDKGRLSTPSSRYFFLPDLSAYGKGIAAYEYWFNHGPRIRINVEPTNPLSLENLWIDIQDVVPNNIPDDYLFDTERETVYCEDDVFFGMQVYDDAGKGSQAVLSDTFRITVPIDPDFIVLRNNIESSFPAPTTGKMQGLKIEAQVGDSLYWEITEGGCVDFYTAEGVRMETQKEETEGKVCYGMKAKTELTYALVYRASDILENMETVCSIVTPTGIAQTTSSFRYHTEKNGLWIESDMKTDVTIISLSGNTVTERSVDVGTCHVNLQSGIYIVRFSNHKPVKVLIP